MNNNEKILTITYFYGTKGCCPAEWADDKIDTMCKLEKNTILITSIFSKKNTSNKVIHYRVPSLSIQDFRHELGEIKNENMQIPYIKLLFFIPFIVTVGLILDLLQKVFTSGNGGGKWSWFFPASIIALYLAIRYNCKKIFTTGGPASAHLAGVFVKKLTGKELICELQDPLTGKDIGRTANSAKMLNVVEKIIMNNSDKVVFVTKNAAEYAKSKYYGFKAQIVAIYPGSKYFTSSDKNKSEENLQKLRLIHLGTLYSTRNMNTLIQAIDELIEEGKIKENQIEVLNLGEIYGEIKEHHLSRNYIKQESIKPREEAINIASSFDISLLVQHTDSRSEATIPYKTYDYINIGNPILALTNSDELSGLLRENGHISVDVNDVNIIKETLVNLISNYQNIKKEINPLAIDIIKQTKKILGI
ncbi:hypothetical protein [Aliarcobacter butzleri]|uniref:hypothetical protein n=1 Tax=Aliarcobacter butzleri TaxID=28197 RepID=UPI0021B2D8BF|nr:hypothetical protein [Aliarcobacter butzleri]MCT7581814.1 hypothetical protein [Aliarcobacter butzleri]